jgi:glycerate 2-kinase
MTRVVVAPDSLKGSLDAFAAAAAISAGVRRADPSIELVEVPMADGGEGTAAVLRSVWGGELVSIDTLDPLGRHLAAPYLRTPDGRAVVEFAAAGGLPLVSDAPDALRADSRGTGILLHHAIEHGATEVVVCLGGSASTDGGAGAFASLGARFLDADGRHLPPGGGSLARLDRVDLDGLVDGFRRVLWTLLCDVTNPMVGPTGAAASFGPQKGASADDVVLLDAGLARLADALETAGCPPVRHLRGAGAAGGAGGGLAAVTGAALLQGAEVVAAAVRLDEAIDRADLVITAEGRIDSQSAAGKVVGAVARHAGALGVPVVGLAGSVAPGFDPAATLGLAATVPIAGGPVGEAEAMTRAGELLTLAAERSVQLLGASRNSRRA